MSPFFFCTALLIFLSGCVMGIPDSYAPPPKPKSCEVKITDGRVANCYTREEFQRWRQRNGM